MVFFTSILIITVLYFLQADGLIYAVIIALTAELINIFLTHTLTKSVEKKLKLRHRRSVEGYIKRIKANKKSIAELEKLQEEAATKIYKANARISELEEELETMTREMEVKDQAKKSKEPPAKAPKPQPAPETARYADHLPDGSKRKPPRA